MIFALRWLFRLIFAAMILGAIGAVLMVYILGRSIPDYEEDFTVAGISAPVEILRDSHAIPRISGASEADVFYALGFAHAQDRLWQMTMLRRTAQGRLSEVFGTRTVRIDEILRRLDLYGAAVDSVAVQDAPTRSALDAYANGVNAWIEQVNLGARGRGAPEMFLFPTAIAAWSPADSIAVIKLMALQLSGQIDTEVTRAKLSALLTAPRLKDILPDDPTKATGGLPDFASLMGAPLPAPTQTASLFDMPLTPFARRSFAGASNAWAAETSVAAAGGGLLANDPHLGLTAPSIWYLAQLNLPSGAIIGATIPGMPLILLGRSDALGWGLTSAYVDDLDMVIERVNPSNPDEYIRDGAAQPFITSQTLLNVKDEATITLTLRSTDAGPVLPPDAFDLGAITPPGHVAAVQWTALSRQDTSMSAAMGLMRAQSIAQAIEVGSGFIAPAQNLFLADRTSVAMQVIGAIPRRDPAHQTKGRMPAPGWEGANIWQGILPYSDNPHFGSAPVGSPVYGNRAQKLVINTNNKTSDRPFPNHVSFDWGDTQRIQRALSLLGAREVHTRESFIEAQLDTVSPTARALLPLIGADLWFTGEPSPEGTPDNMREQALKLLANWNGEMNEHLPEPLITEGWLRALQTRIAQDELGPMIDLFSHPDAVFLERVYRNIEGASVWCDVIQSKAVETCQEMAKLALDDALLDLSQTYGPDIISWRWGDAHQAAHDHPTLGEVPLLGSLVNIRQSTSGGDNTLQRGLTKGTGENPYLNVHGGGYRGVYDFADPDASVFVIATGQSGHPLSGHYDDLAGLWRRGEYLPMSLDEGLARAGALGSTILSPAPAVP
jgi:penicillin amidase